MVYCTKDRCNAGSDYYICNCDEFREKIEPKSLKAEILEALINEISNWKSPKRNSLICEGYEIAIRRVVATLRDEARR